MAETNLMTDPRSGRADMTDKADVSRRDLVLNATAAGAAVAAGTLGASHTAWAQPTALPTKWHHEADVVVIGAGAMGLPAAIVAREAGVPAELTEVSEVTEA